MRTPFYLLILALSACASQQRSIEKVLLEDKRIEDSLATDVQSGKSLAGSFSRAAAAKRAIDLSACPPRFRNAYARHTRAWDSAVEEMEKKSRETLVGFLTGFLGLIADNPAPMLKALYSALTDDGVDMSDVRSTRDNVEEAAMEYGVNGKKIREN